MRIVGMADADARDIGDEIAHCLLLCRNGRETAINSAPMADQVHTVITSRRAWPRLRLRRAPSRVHLSRHDCRRHPPRSPVARACLSFLSPCVLPLVPPYLVYLAGTSLERLADGEPRPATTRETVLAALLFVPASRRYSSRSARAPAPSAAAARLFVGLSHRRRHRHHHHGSAFPRADPDRLAGAREARSTWQSRSGLWGAYVMGLAFAFGWTPCIGPILAAILAVAASEATVAKGAGLLAVYSLGLGMPFVIAAFAVEPFAALLARFRAHLGKVEKVDGRAAGAHRYRLPHRLDHAARAFGCWRRSRCWGGSGSLTGKAPRAARAHVQASRPWARRARARMPTVPRQTESPPRRGGLPGHRTNAGQLPAAALPRR